MVMLSLLLLLLFSSIKQLHASSDSLISESSSQINATPLNSFT
jgi:hypothetical protein